MSGVHRISLNAVWERITQGEATDACWRRRFGNPSGIGPRHQVSFLIESNRVPRRVVLNNFDLSLLSCGPGVWRQDVTLLLRERNELMVVPSGLNMGENQGTVQEKFKKQSRQDLPAEVGQIFLEIYEFGKDCFPLPG